MGDKKGTRNLVRRDLTQAVATIDKTMMYLTRSGRLYQEAHSEIYTKFCIAVALLNDVKTQCAMLHETI